MPLMRKRAVDFASENDSKSKGKPRNPSENREESYSELLQKLRSIEESLNNLKISNNKDDSPGVDFTLLSQSISELKTDINGMSDGVKALIAKSGTVTKADISALWSGKEGKGGLDNIQNTLNKVYTRQGKDFEFIKAGLNFLGKPHSDDEPNQSQGLINSENQEVIKRILQNEINSLKTYFDARVKALKKEVSKDSSNDSSKDFQVFTENIKEKVGDAITEINSKIDGICDKKSPSVDDAAIKSLSSKIEKAVSSKIETSVSSAVQKLNDDAAHKERKFLSKEMIMIMISVLILTVGTVFISYGVLLRYENGLAFDLSWWALIVYGVTFLATLLIIIFHNRLTKGVVASRFVRIFMALFLVATLALSALSLLSVFLL